MKIENTCIKYLFILRIIFFVKNYKAQNFFSHNYHVYDIM